MACIRKRRGKWIIDYRDTTGRRRWKTVTGNRKAAETELAKILRSNGGPTSDWQRVTFKDYATNWVETYAKPNLKQSTVDLYSGVLKHHLYPAFGSMKLIHITRDRVKKLIAQKTALGLSRSHIRSIIIPLREMFYHAIDDGLELPNPAAKIGRFTKSTIKRKIDPLTRAEVATLLSVAKPEDYPVLLFAFRTGARAGEIVAVTAADLDFNSRFVQICRNSSRGVITTPKSGRTRRIDMSLQLTNAMDELVARRKAAALTREMTKPESQRRTTDQVIAAVMEQPLFTRKNGQPLDPNDLRRTILYPALTAAGIRRVRFHDARHTFASLLIQQGESLAYVRDQLGHASIQMTVDTYGHLIPGVNRQAVDKLDDPEPAKGGDPANSGDGVQCDHEPLSDTAPH